MRYVYFLLLAVLISSCAHGRLRLRKVDKEDHQELVQHTSKKDRSDKITRNQIIIEPTSTQEEAEAIAINVEETLENESTSSTDAPERNASESNELTTAEIEDDPSKKQKVRQALIAERDARKAKNAFVWSLSMFATMILPFLGIIALFSIIPFIIGSLKLSQSNKSDYITLEGERDARSARIMQLIYGVLMTLCLVAVAIILIVFVL